MVDSPSFVRPNRQVVLAWAVLAPLIAAALLQALGDRVTTTTAALILVLLVVASAASGLRSAGIVAALSAGAWFDFFLTEPHGSFKVANSDDIQATVLLLLVGVAVSEIALWGRRQEAKASRRAGYLDGVFGTADIVAQTGASPDALIERVRHQIVSILDIDSCRFEPLGAEIRSATRLNHDGSVTRRGAEVDVDRHGLPTDDLIVLDVSQGSALQGRFSLAASTRVVRPTVEQRRVVVLLADQVASALSARASSGGAGAERSASPS